LIQKRKPVETKPRVSFTILPEKQIVQASQGTTILQALLDSKVQIDHSCGGMGTCGTCRLWVEEGLGLLGPRTEAENEIAEDRQFSKNERLSCQCEVQEGLVLKKNY
jgi:ferredoxin